MSWFGAKEKRECRKSTTPRGGQRGTHEGCRQGNKKIKEKTSNRAPKTGKKERTIKRSKILLRDKERIRMQEDKSKIKKENKKGARAKKIKIGWGQVRKSKKGEQHENFRAVVGETGYQKAVRLQVRKNWKVLGILKPGVKDVTEARPRRQNWDIRKCAGGQGKEKERNEKK